MSTKYSTIFPVIFFVLALPLTAPGAKEKPSEATIWPGESYTFEDVTVTWKAPAKRKTETSFGELTFETRGQKSWTVELKENTQAYFNDVYFYLELQMRERSKGIAPGTKLFMRAYHEPSTRFIGGKEGETRAHVSLACPITVNDWEFRVSEKKRPYKDGGEYYQLLGQNRSTGEEQALPFLNGTRRKFGRFDVVLHYTCQSTRTAELVIHYKRDLTQRGRGAYVKDFWVHRDERTLGRLFEIMGERFGFDVEWPQAIEHPEAIETAMATGYTLNPPSNTDVGTGLQDLIHRSRQMSGGPYRPRLKLTWVDDTHLRVEAERIKPGSKKSTNS